ncbi:casein kinase I-like [Ylistrum balloti]|uniref:casein kinase I-like n=1 Tax=Ylistrum balloti TaxID=509963 RepID=UPI002905D5F9|nr:casein kinase I-like [Ylistrum balloti]
MANGENVAVKIDRFVNINSTVRKEGNIYRALEGEKGFPTARWSGREGGYNILVMELLGLNLQKYFELCKLPWQGMKSKIESRQRDKKLEVKRSITVAELCKGLPVEFSEYLNICRSLKFEEKPDYARLRNLFKNAFREQNFTYNHMFDLNDVSGICKTSPENEDNDRCLPVTLPSR